jgi:predicted CXXCH cytochrome family protein
MKERAVWISLCALAVLCAIPSAVPAQDGKGPAGPGAPQDCIACHESGGNFRRNYAMWKESGHSKSISRVMNNSAATADCFACHSDEGFKAKQLGKKVDMAQKASLSSVTCATCHRLPHDSKYPRQLVDDPETLCTSCHSQRSVLQGKGAREIEEARSFHSAVDCISCHMSETNHLMKVIRPDDPGVSEKRVDTCTACHKDNNRKARIAQLQEWQKSYQEAMDPLQANLAALSAALKENPSLLDDKMKAKLNDVRFNLSILVRDRSRGSHNIDFTAEIFSISAKALREIKAAMQPGEGGQKTN